MLLGLVGTISNITASLVSIFMETLALETHGYTYMYIYTHMRVYIYICVYTQLYVRTHVLAYTYSVYTDAYTRVRVFMHGVATCVYLEELVALS